MRFLKGILAVLTARWFLTLVGAAILAALIWYFGPLLAVADQKPLASDFNRLLAILGITLLWGVSNLWSLRRSHARGQALVEAVAKPPPGVPNARSPRSPPGSRRPWTGSRCAGSARDGCTSSPGT